MMMGALQAPVAGLVHSALSEANTDTTLRLLLLVRSQAKVRVQISVHVDVRFKLAVPLTSG